MHINKRDNGFRFQESRTRQVINFIAMATGILMVIGGIFLGSYYDHWLKGLWVAFGGALVVVVTLLRLLVQTKLNSRDAQGRTRSQALMDFWREKGFNGRYPLGSYSELRSWLDMKHSVPTCRVYCHHDGLMVMIREDEPREKNPSGRYFQETRSIKIMTLQSEVVIYELRQEGGKVLTCSLDPDFPQDVLGAVLRGFAEELPVYALFGVSIHELLHPRVDSAVPQLLPLPPLQAA